jgi:hypothetical protein
VTVRATPRLGASPPATAVAQIEAGAERRPSSPRRRLIVFWWSTPTGIQPVLLARDVRLN